MSSFVLRKVDPLLWQRAREKAKSQELEIREVVEAMLVAWLGESPPLIVDGRSVVLAAWREVYEKDKDLPAGGQCRESP